MMFLSVVNFFVVGGRYNKERRTARAETIFQITVIRCCCFTVFFESCTRYAEYLEKKYELFAEKAI